MVGIIDYGVGNLFSLRSSLESIGQEVVVSDDPSVLSKASHLILPGVGAFEDAAQKLRSSGLDAFVMFQAEKQVPILGICLGMQMLFQRSYEYGIHQGLGLLDGEVVSMSGRIDAALKVPHMGWNKLLFTKDSRLFVHIHNGDYVYFVHSYFADGCADSVIAVSDYSIPLTACVEKGNLFGCQFHPEKSGKVGLEILRAFCEI